MEHTIPVPSTLREVDDRFSTILLAAPTFAGLQKTVKYEITLDMMMDSLRDGVKLIAARSSNAESQTLFQECLSEIEVARMKYRENMISGGRARIKAANEMFLRAKQVGANRR